MAKQEKNPPVEEDVKEGDSSGAEAPKKKSSKLKLILVVVLAMAVGGGGAVVAMKVLGGSSQTEAPIEEAEKSETPAGSDTDAPIEAPKRGGDSSSTSAPAADGEAPTEEAAGPQNIEFKPFIVNLNDAGGKRFLKLSMSVEADTPDLATEINSKMPLFQDTILLLLSSLSYDDIATLDGKMRLRNQMLNRINTQLTSGKVKNIYFSEFVVQ